MEIVSRVFPSYNCQSSLKPLWPEGKWHHQIRRKEDADWWAVCERYSLLANDKKQMIAGELDRSVREIERKISVSGLASTTASLYTLCFANITV